MSCRSVDDNQSKKNPQETGFRFGTSLRFILQKQPDVKLLAFGF